MSLIKEKWVRADMREMEFLTEQTLRKYGCREPVMFPQNGFSPWKNTA